MTPDQLTAPSTFFLLIRIAKVSLSLMQVIFLQAFFDQFFQLIQNPQNNLRFFCDGELIYSMETLEHVGASCAKRFPQLIENLCGFPNALEKVVSALCNALGAR